MGQSFIGYRAKSKLMVHGRNTNHLSVTTGYKHARWQLGFGIGVGRFHVSNFTTGPGMLTQSREKSGHVIKSKIRNFVYYFPWDCLVLV